MARTPEFINTEVALGVAIGEQLNRLKNPIFVGDIKVSMYIPGSPIKKEMDALDNAQMDLHDFIFLANKFLQQLSFQQAQTESDLEKRLHRLLNRQEEERFYRIEAQLKQAALQRQRLLELQQSGFASLPNMEKLQILLAKLDTAVKEVEVAKQNLIATTAQFKSDARQIGQAQRDTFAAVRDQIDLPETELLCIEEYLDGQINKASRIIDVTQGEGYTPANVARNTAMGALISSLKGQRRNTDDNDDNERPVNMLNFAKFEKMSPFVEFSFDPATIKKYARLIERALNSHWNLRQAIKECDTKILRLKTLQQSIAKLEKLAAQIDVSNKHEPSFPSAGG